MIDQLLSTLTIILKIHSSFSQEIFISDFKTNKKRDNLFKFMKNIYGFFLFTKFNNEFQLINKIGKSSHHDKPAKP